MAGCRIGNDKVRRTVEITTDAAGTAQFTPLETLVQKGDRVTIVVINRTSRIHGFSIRGYGVPPIEVGPDAPNDMVFTAKREGTFEIFCQLHETHKRAALLVA
jgi:heme/copper-type cytochrome/quinol oxidase subunit 2